MALVDQMIRASRLDTSLYEEVEADTTQTNNALTVVVITAVASGIGAALRAGMNPDPNMPAANPIVSLIGGILVALLGWAVWTACVYWIGTTFLGGTATWGEVLRTVAFAYSPNVLLLLQFVPVLGGLLAAIVGIWTLVAVVVAVRQSLDVGTGKAIIAALLGLILFVIVAAIIGGILAVPLALMPGG